MSISTKEKAEAYKKGVMKERRRILKMLNTLEISFEGEEGDPFIEGDALDLMMKIDYKMTYQILGVE